MNTGTALRPTRSDRADLWTVRFVDTYAAVPVGPNETKIDVAVDFAVLTVSGLPWIVVASLIAAAVADLLVTLGIVAFAAVLCRNLMRGRAFSRTNTRLVFATSFTLVVGTTLVGLFSTMGAKGAFTVLSDRTYDNTVAAGNLLPYFVAIASRPVAICDALDCEVGEVLERT